MGLILGGGLGAGTKALMSQNNPSADLLAKLQTHGELNPTEMLTLKLLC